VRMARAHYRGDNRVVTGSCAGRLSVPAVEESGLGNQAMNPADSRGQDPPRWEKECRGKRKSNFSNGLGSFFLLFLRLGNKIEEGFSGRMVALGERRPVSHRPVMLVVFFRPWGRGGRSGDRRPADWAKRLQFWPNLI
jgi:hypothetical protein